MARFKPCYYTQKEEESTHLMSHNLSLCASPRELKTGLLEIFYNSRLVILYFPNNEKCNWISVQNVNTKIRLSALRNMSIATHSLGFVLHRYLLFPVIDSLSLRLWWGSGTLKAGCSLQKLCRAEGRCTVSWWYGASTVSSLWTAESWHVHV